MNTVFYHINANPKLIRTGGRKSVMMSATELEKKLNKKFSSLTSDPIDLEKDPELISELISHCPQLSKDLEKIYFGTSTVTCTPSDCAFSLMIKDFDLVGYHTLDNGFSFLGCMGYDDCEFPLFFIIYHDGKKIRGYVPAYGNIYNTIESCAFGAEIFEIKESFYVSECSQALIDSAKKFEESDEWTSMVHLSLGACIYLEKEGVPVMKATGDDWHFPTPNWEHIEKDIKSRIVI